MDLKADSMKSENARNAQVNMVASLITHLKILKLNELVGLLRLTSSNYLQVMKFVKMFFFYVDRHIQWVKRILEYIFLCS